MSKLNYLKKLDLSNKNFGDEFCEDLCYKIYQNDDNILRILRLNNNPRITSVGLKYLYTILIANRVKHRNSKKSMKLFIEVSCLEEMKPEINLLVNKGLSAALKAKYRKYIKNFKERGFGYYDSECFLMILYTIFCLPFACTQIFTPQLKKKRCYIKFQSFLKTILECFGEKKKQYQAFDL